MPVARETLDAIRNAISDDVTRHASISQVLDGLTQFEIDDPKQIRHAWDTNAYHLARLVRDGVLERKLVDSLANEVVSLTTIPKAQLEDFKQSTEKLIDQMTGDTRVVEMAKPGIPEKYYEQFSAGFTLRALAIHPKRVLPPGKSLISLFMSNETEEKEKEQKKVIEDTLKRVYWDTVSDTLMTFPRITKQS